MSENDSPVPAAPEGQAASTMLDWIGRWWPWVVVLYFVVWALLAGLVIWLNVERDPSIEAGVAMGAGAVALIVVGVNGLFLFALIEQIQTGASALETASDTLDAQRERLNQDQEQFAEQRLEAQRSLAPYVYFQDSEPRVANAGHGMAIDVRISVFNLLSSGRWKARIALFAVLPAQSEGKRAQTWHDMGDWSITAIDHAAPLYHVSCRDVLGSYHRRWFGLQMGGREFNELPGGEVPSYAVRVPDERTLNVIRELHAKRSLDPTPGD